MRDRICAARRVVVKLGSNLFFNDAGVIALGRIFSFIEDIAAAQLAGRQMIVVSSGAVALGADALKMKSATASLAQKQALAAVGQSRLMNLYEQGFGKRSEEHTSELQSRLHLVCRLLLEKKK